VRKAGLAMSVVVSLITLSMSVRAAVITYSCAEPDDPTHTMTFRIDTKTHRAIDSEAGGTAQLAAHVTGSAIVLRGKVPRAWTIQIDRSSGASLDSDGSSGTCQLVK
jgi:hypothetical protein